MLGKEPARAGFLKKEPGGLEAHYEKAEKFP
jgi:hypothetical protein